jgi:hypothetical protein
MATMISFGAGSPKVVSGPVEVPPKTAENSR